MNKIVFLMDGDGNAVQWAAGMRISPAMIAGKVCFGSGDTCLCVSAKDPRKCVEQLVHAISVCPDPSLLRWDEESQSVVRRGWGELIPAADPVDPAAGKDEWQEATALNGMKVRYKVSAVDTLVTGIPAVTIEQ